MVYKTDLPSMQKDADYFSQDTWLKIREETGFGERVRSSSQPLGKGHCYRWVEWMHQKIGAHEQGFKSARTIGTSADIVRESGLLDHVWIEAEMSDGRRYIADGTAGQVDPKYFDGFYGAFDEASPLLQRVYAERQIWRSVFEKKSA